MLEDEFHRARRDIYEVARDHDHFATYFKRKLDENGGVETARRLLADRTDRRHLGDEATDPLIDQLHRAMRLWKAERRPDLVRYLSERAGRSRAVLETGADAVRGIAAPRDRRRVRGQGQQP